MTCIGAKAVAGAPHYSSTIDCPNISSATHDADAHERNRHPEACRAGKLKKPAYTERQQRRKRPDSRISLYRYEDNVRAARGDCHISPLDETLVIFADRDDGFSWPGNVRNQGFDLALRTSETGAPAVGPFRRYKARKRPRHHRRPFPADSRVPRDKLVRCLRPGLHCTRSSSPLVEALAAEPIQLQHLRSWQHRR